MKALFLIVSAFVISMVITPTAKCKLSDELKREIIVYIMPGYLELPSMTKDFVPINSATVNSSFLNQMILMK